MRFTLILNGREYGYADDNSKVYSSVGLWRYENVGYFNSCGDVYAEPKSPFGTKRRIGRIDFCNDACKLYYYNEKVGEIDSLGNVIISGNKVQKCYGGRFEKKQIGAALLLLYFHAGLAPSSSDSSGASFLGACIGAIYGIHSINKTADKTHKETQKIQQNITAQSDKKIEKADDVNGKPEITDKNSDNHNKGIKGAVFAIIALVVIVMIIAVGSRG